MNILLIGNAVSMVGCLIMVGIGFLKRKQHILLAQSVQCLFMGAGNLILGGVSGFICNVVTIARNLVFAKWDVTLPLKLFFIALQVVLSLGSLGDGLICWLPILAAAGCNCTVRKRLPKARDVLRRFGYGDFSANLERVLGCHGMTAAELLPHMDALERTYYLAMGTKGPSEEYAFRSDIRPDAKAVAIDGTRELLLSENPSDAVFWMIATFTRCMTILRMDDMDAYRACLADMRAFAAALGVADARGIAARHALALQTLADAEEIARRIAAETAR